MAAPTFLRRYTRATVSGALVCALVFLPAPARTQTAQNPAPAVPLDAKKAQKAAERGDKLESQGKDKEALAAYEEAARFAPNDPAIVGRGAALKSKMVRVHVEAAERLALGGQVGRATQELLKALEIDPDDTVVAQRLAEMKSMEGATEAEKVKVNLPDLPRLAQQPGKRDVNLRGDTRTVYEQLGHLFGLKATFDADLTPRTVKLKLEGVDFGTAATVLERETATFWNAVDSTTFFVAADTPAKRKEFEPVAEQTFTLAESASPEDMTEVLRILRDISGATRLQLNTGSRTITIRDTPEKLAMASELIRQMEKARGEIMLEFELLEVDRDAMRNLGVKFPTQAQLFSIPTNIQSQLSQAKDLNTLLTLLAGIFGTAATGGTIGSVVPPIVKIGGGKSTFLLTLPGSAVQFSEALSVLQSGRQVLMRAQNGKPATFFVGDRFPVTLSLLSGSLGNGGFTPSVGGAANPFPSTTYPTGNGTVALVNADFRNIGLFDLAALNELDNTVTVLLNQGPGQSTGTFAEATGSPISLGSARTATPAIAPVMASAVLTSSGFHDLLITEPDNNDVIVLTSNGDGTFTKGAMAIPVGKGPSALVTADFDGDGNQDFAVTNETDNTISVFLGDGKGGFTQATGSPIALPSGVTGPTAMTLGDFNADGRQDLAIAANNNNTTQPGEFVVMLNQGSGAFAPAGPAVVVGKSPVAIASADFDTNGSADLAIVNQVDNSISVLLNNGAATFTQGPTSPLATGPTPTGIAVGDFAGTGTVDIAVTNSGSDSASVYTNAGLGELVLAFEAPAGSVPSAIIAASLSGQALPDFAIANNPSGQAGDVDVILTPTSAFSGLGGLAQQPYPGSEYVDLGVKVKATPQLHDKNEVTLQLEFDITALAGTSVNGIPVISNRTVSQTVRVKEGQPTIIGGLTDREETKAITGLPGFANLPGIGYAFGTRNTEKKDTELLILVTPRRLRAPARTSKPYFVGFGDNGPAAAPRPD
ncbi:MAG TPA: FG-GAP-like repeat-containing protein [Candidatus Acidoferrales bacterium]|nr:FG-GAP-like repeat-containing protein [Candidatus Acidoferrales bacterium]